MKNSLLTALLFFIGSFSFGQNDNNSAEENPYKIIDFDEKKIKIKENGISCGKIDVSILPTYSFTGDFYFGSQLMVKINSVDGIEAVHDLYYIFGKDKITNKKTKEVIYETDFSFAEQGRGFKKIEGKNDLYVTNPLTIKRPMYPGTYEYEIELRDYCDDDFLKVIVEVEVKENPLFTIEASKGVDYSDFFLVPERTGFISVSGEIPYGPVEVMVDELTGFKNVDGFYHVGLEMALKSADGETLLYDKDIFKDEGKGMLESDDKSFNFDPYFTFDEADIGKSYVIQFNLFDKNSEAYITFSSPIKIVE